MREISDKNNSLEKKRNNECSKILLKYPNRMKMYNISQKEEDVIYMKKIGDNGEKVNLQCPIKSSSYRKFTYWDGQKWIVDMDGYYISKISI